LKWIIILCSPSLAGVEVFSWADVSVAGKEVMASPWYWFAVALYLLLTPVQEFVARCGIQAPLYAFLQGSELKRHGLAIVVSNLVFSAAHAHIGFAFAAATFIPGLFWGWIIARTNSLLAASLSHFVIGEAGIFLFGIEEFVQKLF
jgi:membrane protease YdiL (CAAX protease family)